MKHQDVLAAVVISVVVRLAVAHASVRRHILPNRCCAQLTARQNTTSPYGKTLLKNGTRHNGEARDVDSNLLPITLFT